MTTEEMTQQVRENISSDFLCISIDGSAFDSS
jgi:hypothetical protein